MYEMSALDELIKMSFEKLNAERYICEISAAKYELSSLRIENDRLKKGISDAIDLAEECIGYASSYFNDKHGIDSELARLKGEYEETK